LIAESRNRKLNTPVLIVIVPHPQSMTVRALSAPATGVTMREQET
jgi:hypothetical protein